MESMGQDVMTRFRQGDSRAFTAIYNTNYARLFAFIRRLLNNNRQEAQDICAETFVKLWKLKENFETIDSLRAFLYVTARNACYDYLKQSSREVSQEPELIQQIAPGTDHLLMREEIKADVIDYMYQEIEKLPRQCKTVIQLSLKGLKNNEIAEQLNITDKTVRNQKVLARRLLRIAVFDHLRAVSLLLSFVPIGWL